VRTAFRALDATLQSAGASLDTIFYAYAYPVNAMMLQKYRDVRFEFLKRDRAPASTNLAFEGVMTPDHTIGVDVIALPR
jgi:enamine deaminase RidA (YjgF/YER057c/UK114 family)